MTWMLRLLFSQPSPVKAAFLIAPKKVRHMMSKGSLKHIENHWEHNSDGKSFRVLQMLCWVPHSHGKENRNATLPTAAASGSTAIFTITSRDRTATVPFCHRNWETAISSGCVTYKKIIVCLHSLKADFLSLPGRMLPFGSPREGWLPLSWDSLAHFWWKTMS